MASSPQLSGRRIQVVGITAAGKSTFARSLGKLLSIPVLELDSLFYESRATGRALSEDEAKRALEAYLESNKEWILDGNHWVQFQNISYSIATDILWMDTPLPLTLWRVITRTIWEVLTMPGALQRELCGNSLIAMSIRVRSKKHANWAKRAANDPRWKRLSGWYGRDSFLAGVKNTL